MRTNEELIADYRAGEADALNELAKQNRGLIASVAWDWCERRKYWDDTFQECSLAFLMAVHGYDPKRARKFSTLAITAMNHHMRNLVVYRSAQKRTGKVVPVNESISSRETPIFDLIQVKIDAMNALNLIENPRTRDVVWSAMNGFTYKEIGKRLGVTFDRIRQVKEKGLVEIQDCLRHD